MKWVEQLKLVGWLLLGTLCGVLATISATAATKQMSNDIGFSVAAKLPDNQISKSDSYFDLKMTPGKSQTIQATVYNVTDRDLQVETAIHTAYTNSNGAIEYVTPAKTFDPSLKHRMATITKVQGPHRITIPANGSKVVTATVQMPTAKFNGVILGGWYFKRVNQKITGTVKGSMNIKNQYSYVIGLKYTVGAVPTPALQLDRVTAGMLNYHRGIFPELRNTAAVIVPGLTVDTKITSQNRQTVVKTRHEKGVQLAPNSVYRDPLLTGPHKLQAGKYHLHMTVTNTAHHWVFDRDFTISNAAAQKVNRQSVDNGGIRPLWLIALGALGMLVIILVLVWLGLIIWKRRRQRQD